MYSSSVDLFFDAVALAGFEVSVANNETDFCVNVNGIWGEYCIYAVYNACRDVVSFSVPLVLNKYCIAGKKLSEKVDLLNLKQLVDVANSKLDVGYFKIVNQDVVYTIQVPLIKYLRISASLIQKLISIILEVCDLFLPGYIISLSDENFDIKNFEMLTVSPIGEA